MDMIRFSRPRFIAHYERGPSGDPVWTVLTLPGTGSTKDSSQVNEWQIRNGSIEIWDQTRTPTVKWVADQFNGSFLVSRQTGAMAGKVARSDGQDAIVDLHYDGADRLPCSGTLQ